MNPVIYDTACGIAIWMVCAVINIFWLQCYPKLVHPDSRPLLIVFAPLCTFFIAMGMLGTLLYKLPLTLTRTRLNGFQ